MPLIWCSISHHGFGHGAQVIPVLNELSRHIPNLRVLLRTTLPESFIRRQIDCEWEVFPAEQDIGCVQQGPLQIDVPKTWEEYERFHSQWKEKIEGEAKIMRSHNPDLVLSNISYLGIEAGACAGCPTVALSSLSWDQVLKGFVSNGSESQQEIVHQICQSYQSADRMIRLAPGIPMVAFRDLVDVGPIGSRQVLPSGEIRNRLGVKPDERLVLVAFGGIPLNSLPVDRLEQLNGFRFLIGGSEHFEGYTRVFSTGAFSVPFSHILAEADIVITKPGYATVVDSVNQGIPIVYVRRYNFIDEQLLVDYAHQHIPAVELSLEQFHAGDWQKVLDHVQSIPFPKNPPPKSGVSAAASLLAEYFS